MQGDGQTIQDSTEQGYSMDVGWNVGPFDDVFANQICSKKCGIKTAQTATITVLVAPNDNEGDGDDDIMTLITCGGGVIFLVYTSFPFFVCALRCFSHGPSLNHCKIFQLACVEV